jgi:transketolase
MISNNIVKSAEEIEKAGTKATRDAYGEALIELGNKNENVIVLDADLSSSTRTSKFKDVFPDRHFNAGIAEANMMAMASGIARNGKIVFASSFAIFATGRCWEQIRNSVAHDKVNVKIAATHAGIAVGPDGSSHQAIEDIAIMRCIPNMKVFVPADAVEAKKCIFKAAETDGPVYIRLGRSKTPVFLNDNYNFEEVKGVVLKQGSDITLIACGNLVYNAYKASEELEKSGISARVINMGSIKPIDKDLIIAAAKETSGIVTCEEHSIIGGLGAAVSAVTSKHHPCRVLRVGLRNVFGQSGEPDELFEHYGLTSGHIVDKAKELVDLSK